MQLFCRSRSKILYYRPVFRERTRSPSKNKQNHILNSLQPNSKTWQTTVSFAFCFCWVLGYTAYKMAVVTPQRHRIGPNPGEPEPSAGRVARGITEFIGRRIRKGNPGKHGGGEAPVSWPSPSPPRPPASQPPPRAISPLRFPAFCPSNRNSMSYSPTYHSP